jgi:ribonuclease R
VDIRPKVRHFGHQIIEEFMIAANEAVANFLSERDEPCMYRVHPPPEEEKLKELFKLLRDTQLGPDLPETTDVRGLQELLNLAENSDLEFLVNRLILRSMMQAFYTPENSGHFGLASDCYCHFTSPIRRYADLIVHRHLKAALNMNTAPGSKLKKLHKTGQHLSNTERKAMEAEREIFKRLTILFLQEKVGQTYTGIIASIADFGFWVELNEVLAEGMVRLSSLQDDYYVYWPDKHKLVGQHTGKIFYLGQKVKVRLIDTNLSRQEITLELDEEDQASTSA